MTTVVRYPRAKATQAYVGAAGTELVSEEQVAKLTTLCNECGAHPIKLAKTFRVETLADLPAAKFQRAIERINHYRTLHASGPSRDQSDQADRAREYPWILRADQHDKAGMDVSESLRFALAEELAKGRPWSRQLLKWVAECFLEMYEPKLKAWHQERVQEPAIERAMIDWYAGRLKEQGVRAYRHEAEKLYAQKQNVTFHALRKRRQRHGKY